MNHVGDRWLVSAAVLSWLGVGAYGIWQMAGDGDDGSWERPYLLFTLALLMAIGATTGLAWNSPRGTDRRALRIAGAAAAVLAVASSVLAWAIPLWATLLSICCLLFAAVARPQVRPGLLMLGIAPLVGIAAMVVASVAELGRQDSYGDYPAAFGLGTTTIAVGCLIGLGLLGLRGRETRPQQMLSGRDKASATA